MSFDPKITRQKAKVLSIENRKNNFNLIEYGFTDEEAKLECKRCLHCVNPSCQQGCPLSLPIRDMIEAINNDDMEKASMLVNNISPFTYLCSLVCDHQKQCEGHCIRNKKGEAVGIGNLHRYICEHSTLEEIKSKIPNGKTIAIIGAGPAGISAAYSLYLKGYDVTIFEKENNIGGIPFLSIPSFRLSNKQLFTNYQLLKDSNIKFILNKAVSIDDLKGKYDALFVSIGTQLSLNPNIPGSNLPEVITSDKLLKDIKIYNNLEKYKPYKNVYVIGCGNVALDAARTLIRIVPNVTIVYRRSIDEAPGRKEEIKDAELEGVKLLFLTNPIKYIGTDHLEKIELIQMSLGEKDSSGRASFKEVDGSNYEMNADLVVLALSSKADNKYLNGINCDKNGLIIVNDKYQTSLDNVFAAGDVVTGPNTVVHALNSALKAANCIDNYLQNKK